MKLLIALSEAQLKTSAAYFAQCVVAIVIFVIFLHYSRLNKGHFLKLWSYSWLAFFFNMFLLGCITLFWDVHSFWRTMGSYLSLVALMLHIFFLITGTVRLVHKKRLTQRQMLYAAVIIVLVAGLITLPYSTAEQYARERYLIRVGCRYLIVLAGFFWAGYTITFAHRTIRGVGQKLIALLFFSYAAYHIYYLVIVVGNSLGYSFSLPFFFGIGELVLVSVLGFSMIIYLLEEKQDQLLSTNRELDTFLYRTSHDLRSPITTMLSLTQLAKREVPDPVAHQYLEMIDERVKRLDTVIGDILRLVQNKNLEPNVTEFRFSTLMQEALEESKFIPGFDRVRITYQIPEEEFVQTDYLYLKIIIVNLLENALKYRDIDKELSTIDVRFMKRGNFSRIEITDNGQGIPTEYIPRIFEMFYRANTGSAGTGLGLYIVSQMITKIDGKISVHSTFGSSTTFAIELPVR